MLGNDPFVASALPTWVSPMLARSGRGVPVNLEDWAIEPKWDGWRCLARIDDGAVRLTSRWRHDLTSLFSELADFPSEIAPRKLLLDGEIVALRPDGSQDFHALTNRRPRRSTRLAFMCFDVLHIDGRDLIHDAYAPRRRALEELQLKQDRWLTTPSLQHEAGAALYASAVTAMSIRPSEAIALLVAAASETSQS